MTPQEQKEQKELAEFKVRIKFKATYDLDSVEMYKLLLDLNNRTPFPIYIEAESEDGQLFGMGEAGEDAD